MAKTMAKAAMAMAVLAGGYGRPAIAAEPSDTTVVVHVRDYQHVVSGDLAEAEQVASEVYARIGVQLVWAKGAAKLAEPDGNLHVDVVIMTGAMAAKDAPDALTFGKASHHTKRAHIYFTRVRTYGFDSGSGQARVLGLVLAHELGHVLLPEYSHTPSGLMRATWEGRIARVPGFEPSQATTIRETLMARR